jgi:hypothetical protein
MTNRTERSGRRTLTLLIFALIFVCGLAVGYLAYTGALFPKAEAPLPLEQEEGVEYRVLMVSYPVGGRLVMEERRVERVVSRRELARAAVEEFLKGPSSTAASAIPTGAVLRHVYEGSDDLLYLDFSDEMRTEFRGDVRDEFLLLRGLYETVVGNVYDVAGVKVLVEGLEVESLGGHVSVLRPLGEAVARTAMEEHVGR